MMKNYVSPKIMFQELVFFEKIANACWAIKNSTFDFDNDQLAPLPITVTLDDKGGCGTDSGSIFNQIVSYFNKHDPNNVSFLQWKTKYENNNSLSNTKSDGFKFPGSN